MSFNRENVIWQSKDGTWNRGFYTVDWEDPNGDPEWDVEYDMGSFQWASTGHATEEAAERSWDGANPGGHWSVAHNDKTAAECNRLDEMATEYKKRERQRPRVRMPLHYGLFARF